MKYLSNVIYGICYPFVFWGRLYGKLFRYLKNGIEESDKWEETASYWVVYILSLMGLGALAATPFLAIHIVLFSFLGGIFNVISIVVGVAIMIENLYY